MKHEDIKMDKKMAKKAIGMHDKQMHGGKKTDLSALKKGGKVKRYEEGGKTVAMGSQEDRKQSAMTNKGYEDTAKRETAKNEADAKAVRDTMMYIPRKIKQALTPDSKKKGGSVKAKCMARGGGCEVRGKTKGRMI
jgi:hypothetical protein